MNRRTPVLVGVGQLSQRPDDPTTGAEPLEMMLSALHLAAEDAGKPELLAKADSVRVLQGLWHYSDPARAIARRIGAPLAQSVGTVISGSMVQSVFNHAAFGIQRGELDVVLMAAAEHGYSTARARRADIRLPYSPAPGKPDLVLGGSPQQLIGRIEIERGIALPIHMYPLVESGIRHARGESLADNSVRISELWERFNRVACDNPNAWIRQPISAEQIRTVSPDNRMIGFPYPKLMNSNNAVDQAAALILTSVGTAERLGIDPARFVFPLAVVDAHDEYRLSHRDELHRSPAMRIAGRRLFEEAETSVDDIEHVDVYSCFPSAVQVTARELGLAEERPLTVTGGLTFAGGPFNSYVMHSIATMAETLRRDRGARGLVTGTGGYLTKYAMAIYSCEPPSRPLTELAVQDEIDRAPTREAAPADYSGQVSVECYTVAHERGEPTRVHAACRLDDGRRSWAVSGDRELARAMTQEEFCGRRGRVDEAGELRVA